MTPRHRTQGQAGFSLIEVAVALFVTAVGVLGVGTLIAYGTRLQTTARDVTIAAAAGRQELERLRMAPPLSAKRTVGGSLTTNMANHWTTVQMQGMTFRCRWQIVDSVANTREVSLVVLPPNTNFPLATMGGRLWP